MDFESFKDPKAYIGQDMPFVTDRFMGPVVGLKDLKISYKGVGGKGASLATLTNVVVDLTLEFQDVKMLFKNLDDSANIKYKDLFGAPPKGEYGIIIELGYSIPDNLDLDLEILARRKMVLNLYPNAGKTNITYNENGSAIVNTSLEGYTETVGQIINLLDPKYYKNTRKSANMLVIENQEQFSTEDLKEKQADLVELLADQRKEVKLPGKPGNAASVKGSVEKLKVEIKELQKKGANC